ncbi:MAG: tetratricopeptide repeat protein [bacterium]|nr:tetratricopeptide repeat protein [bacterium]
MKRILILFLAAVLAGIFWWYVQSGRKDIAADLNLENPQSLDKSLAVGGNQTTGVTEPAKADILEDIQGWVLKIIARPIVVTASLPESSRQQAVAKIQELNESIKNYYDEVYQWYDLGAYRRLIGDYDGAIEAWTFGSILRPKDYIFDQNLGDLYAFYLKDYAKGERSFLQSIQKNPQNVSAYQQLAILYEFSLKDIVRTENILLEGIRENSEVAVLKIELGKYYIRLGRKADAIKYFDEALALTPDNQELREELAALKS